MFQEWQTGWVVVLFTKPGTLGEEIRLGWEVRR